MNENVVNGFVYEIMKIADQGAVMGVKGIKEAVDALTNISSPPVDK